MGIDMTQPEALMLADKLEQRFWITSTHHYLDRDAAAELRRLHAQRDALLEALKMLVLATKDFSIGHYNEEVHDIALSKARAAIANAEEQA